ncbi:MAG: DUF4493 domain-containing protein [Muribaculaceae bacterium]|nr:DUF4493 domain-containing protein [Muribaculaceae bacterium]
MKTIYTIALGFLLSLGFLSCNKEKPFEGESTEGTGRFLTSAINVEVKAEEAVTRTAGVPTPDEFTVAFCKKETLNEALYQYNYKEMPEVVTLPVGEYIVKAFYGNDNIVAAFDAPAYYGESEILKVENGKVIDVVNPIVCTLYNVRVAVYFDQALKEVMGEDVKVAVKVGESGALDFTSGTESDGFFKYDEDSSTLSAVFTGTVNGAYLTETKTYDKIKRGTYYKLTFKLHGVETGAEEPGSSSGSLKIDATVTFHDQSGNGGLNVDPDSEEYLEDDRYPGNGDTEDPGEQPGQPVDPDNKTLPWMESDDVDINTVTDISDWEEGKSLAVKILSPSLLTKFVCIIDSSTLTPKELESVNLKSELDLINDTDLFDNLGGLGFPVGEDITNPKTQDEDGNYIIVFDITKFVTMLNALGEGTHNFIFNLENEAGEKVCTLKLKS